MFPDPQLQGTDAMPSPDEIKNKIQQFMTDSNQAKTASIQSQSAIEDARTQAMQQAFEVLKEAGVNPADPSSLAEFMQKLESLDPDAAEMMQNALSAIFGGEEAAPPASVNPEMPPPPSDSSIMPGLPGGPSLMPPGMRPGTPPPTA